MTVEKTDVFREKPVRVPTRTDRPRIVPLATAVRGQAINLLSSWHGSNLCSYVLSFIIQGYS